VVPDWCFREERSTGSFPGTQTVFATVINGWSRLKNGKAALRAFALVRQHISGAQLLMIGADFERGGPAWSWAKAHDCTERVQFLGSLEYSKLLRTLAQQVTIIVHPSLNEACPMILAEAMAIGVPVIAGQRSGGVPFVLDGGAAGVLVDVRSPKAIAEAMCSLATDGRKYDRFAAEGKRQAAARFTPESVTQQYESVYRHVLTTTR
jgi:glycosyltransferase involved in cell wall biosynthesis